MNRGTVTLPVEAKVRELDEKVALSARLAAEGHEVILGPDPSIDAFAAERRVDVHFINSAVHTDTRLRLIPALAARGVRLLLLDTEGAVYKDTPNLRARFYPALLPHFHRYLAWGTAQRDIAVDKLGMPDEKVIVTGIPRFDLLRTPYSAVHSVARRRIREKYGPFLLVNTNHTRANPYAPKVVRDNAPDAVAVEHQRIMIKAYGEALPAIVRAFPSLNIVLRPHPAEKMSTYERMFAGESRIHVVHEGSVQPWIEEAIAAVHNNCTTGLEALLAGIPVAALDPTGWQQEDFTIGNDMSIIAKTTQELVDFVRACVEGRPPPSALDDPRKRSEVRAVVANVDMCAMDAVTDAVRASAKGVAAKPGRPNLRVRARRAALAVLGERGVHAVRRVKFARHVQKLEYAIQKFNGLTHAEIESRVDALRPAIGLPPIEIRPVTGFEHTFRITARSK